MGIPADDTEVAIFLETVKVLVAEGRYDFVPRRKNMMSLAEHNLTISDAKDEIMNLTVGDYYKGPKKDYDTKRPGDIWEFKKDVNGDQFYVKLKISQRSDGAVVKCLSFHEDEFAG